MKAASADGFALGTVFIWLQAFSLDGSILMSAGILERCIPQRDIEMINIHEQATRKDGNEPGE